MMPKTHDKDCRHKTQGMPVFMQWQVSAIRLQANIINLVSSNSQFSLIGFPYANLIEQFADEARHTESIDDLCKKISGRHWQKDFFEKFRDELEINYDDESSIHEHNPADDIPNEIKIIDLLVQLLEILQKCKQTASSHSYSVFKSLQAILPGSSSEELLTRTIEILKIKNYAYCAFNGPEAFLKPDLSKEKVLKLLRPKIKELIDKKIIKKDPSEYFEGIIKKLDGLETIEKTAQLKPQSRPIDIPKTVPRLRDYSIADSDPLSLSSSSSDSSILSSTEDFSLSDSIIYEKKQEKCGNQNSFNLANTKMIIEQSPQLLSPTPATLAKSALLVLDETKQNQKSAEKFYVTSNSPAQFLMYHGLGFDSLPEIVTNLSVFKPQAAGNLQELSLQFAKFLHDNHYDIIPNKELIKELDATRKYIDNDIAFYPTFNPENFDNNDGCEVLVRTFLHASNMAAILSRRGAVGLATNSFGSWFLGEKSILDVIKEQADNLLWILKVQKVTSVSMLKLFESIHNYLSVIKDQKLVTLEGPLERVVKVDAQIVEKMQIKPTLLNQYTIVNHIMTEIKKQIKDFPRVVLNSGDIGVLNNARYLLGIIKKFTGTVEQYRDHLFGAGEFNEEKFVEFKAKQLKLEDAFQHCEEKVAIFKDTFRNYKLNQKAHSYQDAERVSSAHVLASKAIYDYIDNFLILGEIDKTSGPVYYFFDSYNAYISDFLVKVLYQDTPYEEVMACNECSREAVKNEQNSLSISSDSIVQSADKDEIAQKIEKITPDEQTRPTSVSPWILPAQKNAPDNLEQEKKSSEIVVCNDKNDEKCAADVKTYSQNDNGVSLAVVGVKFAAAIAAFALGGVFAIATFGISIIAAACVTLALFGPEIANNDHPAKTAATDTTKLPLPQHVIAPRANDSAAIQKLAPEFDKNTNAAPPQKTSPPNANNTEACKYIPADHAWYRNPYGFFPCAREASEEQQSVSTIKIDTVSSI